MKNNRAKKILSLVLAASMVFAAMAPTMSFAARDAVRRDVVTLSGDKEETEPIEEETDDDEADGSETDDEEKTDVEKDQEAVAAAKTNLKEAEALVVGEGGVTEESKDEAVKEAQDELVKAQEDLVKAQEKYINDLNENTEATEELIKEANI